jgi:hypothetical protein
MNECTQHLNQHVSTACPHVATAAAASTASEHHATKARKFQCQRDESCASHWETTAAVARESTTCAEYAPNVSQPQYDAFALPEPLTHATSCLAALCQPRSRIWSAATVEIHTSYSTGRTSGCSYFTHQLCP